MQKTGSSAAASLLFTITLLSIICAASGRLTTRWRAISSSTSDTQTQAKEHLQLADRTDASEILAAAPRPAVKLTELTEPISERQSSQTLPASSAEHPGRYSMINELPAASAVQQQQLQYMSNVHQRNSQSLATLAAGRTGLDSTDATTDQSLATHLASGAPTQREAVVFVMAQGPSMPAGDDESSDDHDDQDSVSHRGMYPGGAALRSQKLQQHHNAMLAAEAAPDTAPGQAVYRPAVDLALIKKGLQPQQVQPQQLDGAEAAAATAADMRIRDHQAELIVADMQPQGNLTEVAAALASGYVDLLNHTHGPADHHHRQQQQQQQLDDGKQQPGSSGSLKPDTTRRLKRLLEHSQHVEKDQTGLKEHSIILEGGPTPEPHRAGTSRHLTKLLENPPHAVQIASDPAHESNSTSPSVPTSAESPRLVACTLMKNEVPYVVEWIEFHRLMGKAMVLTSQPQF